MQYIMKDSAQILNRIGLGVVLVEYVSFLIDVPISQ